MKLIKFRQGRNWAEKCQCRWNSKSQIDPSPDHIYTTPKRISCSKAKNWKMNTLKSEDQDSIANNGRGMFRVHIIKKAITRTNLLSIREWPIIRTIWNHFPIPNPRIQVYKIAVKIQDLIETLTWVLASRGSLALCNSSHCQFYRLGPSWWVCTWMPNKPTCWKTRTCSIYHQIKLDRWLVIWLFIVYLLQWWPRSSWATYTNWWGVKSRYSWVFSWLRFCS